MRDRGQKTTIRQEIHGILGWWSKLLLGEQDIHLGSRVTLASHDPANPSMATEDFHEGVGLQEQCFGRTILIIVNQNWFAWVHSFFRIESRTKLFHKKYQLDN